MTRPDNELFEFGSFRLNPAEHLLVRNGEPVPLEPKVLETLLVLIRRGGRLVGKDELMQTVWPDSFVEESNLTRNISVLRKALNRNAGGPQYIETVPKRGYRFVGEVRALASEQTELIVQSAKVSVVVEEEDSDGETERQDDGGTRRALRDSAGHPRSIEAAAGRATPFIGTLKQESDDLRSGGPISGKLSGRLRLAGRWWLAFAAAVCLAVGFVLALKFYDSSARQPPWKVIRLTADAGGLG
jgi:DNA-binding winged helix-turn-helix (wHTH) protein